MYSAKTEPASCSSQSLYNKEKKESHKKMTKREKTEKVDVVRRKLSGVEN